MPKVVTKIYFIPKGVVIGEKVELKPYGCEFCHMRHSVNFCVDDHAVGRYEGDFVRCMFCEKRFRVKENFAKHLQKIHLSMAKEIVWRK